MPRSVECSQALSPRYVEYPTFPSRVQWMTSFFKLQYHFGPTVRLISGVLAATEGLIGLTYDADDHNLYRLESLVHIEFLEIEKEGVSANLLQPVRDLLHSLARCLLTL
jgi:hypothetical protein